MAYNLMLSTFVRCKRFHAIARKKVVLKVVTLDELENISTYIDKRKLSFVTKVHKYGNVQGKMIFGIYKYFYKMKLKRVVRLLTCAHNLNNNVSTYTLGVIQQLHP